MAEIKFDIPQIKTKALAAAAPYIEPYQNEVRKLKEFELKQAKIYHTNPDDVPNRELWTQKENKEFERHIKSVAMAADKLEEFMMPVMKNSGLSMGIELDRRNIAINPVHPNGRDVVNQIIEDLTNQAMKPKELEQPKAFAPFGKLPDQQKHR